MNARIHYMYRDASNYKSFNTAVVDGILSDTDCHIIYHCCDDDGGQRYFVPHMVGLPEKTFEDFGQYDDDHPWFEIDQFFAEGTDDAPTVDLTAKQLVENFRKMAGKWAAEIAREAKEAAEKEYMAQRGQEMHINRFPLTLEVAEEDIDKFLDAIKDSIADDVVDLSESSPKAVAQPKTATTPYSIRMTASCFTPTVTMTFDVPKDRDAEEYIDEYLDAILSEDFRLNCEWEFV